MNKRIQKKIAKRMASKMKLSNEIRSKVCGEKFTRDFKLVERAAVEEDDRTIKLSFASEEPYERWWGVEIIDMQKMDLKRLQTGAALLLNHDHSYRNGHIGRIEKAWIDGAERRLDFQSAT